MESSTSQRPEHIYVNIRTIALLHINRWGHTVAIPNCKYEGNGKYITKGSVAVELVLWLLFLFPGLVYSVWRLSTKKGVCPECDFENVRKIKETKEVCMPGMLIKTIAGIIGIIILLYILGLIGFTK